MSPRKNNSPPKNTAVQGRELPENQRVLVGRQTARQMLWDAGKKANGIRKQDVIRE